MFYIQRQYKGPWHIYVEHEGIMCGAFTCRPWETPFQDWWRNGIRRAWHKLPEDGRLCRRCAKVLQSWLPDGYRLVEEAADHD
jgi:hypothetical protein